MSRPDPSTLKVHLLGLEPGERFTLSRGPGAEVYEVVEGPPSEQGDPAIAVVRKPDGTLSPTAWIYMMNESSYFVFQVPSLNPKGTS